MKDEKDFDKININTTEGGYKTTTDETEKISQNKQKAKKIKKTKKIIFISIIIIGIIALSLLFMYLMSKLIRLSYIEGLNVYENNGLYGVYDSEKNIVISAEYEELGVMDKIGNSEKLFDENGLTIAKKDGKWGIINYKNEVVLDFAFDEIGYYCDKCFRVGTWIDYYLDEDKKEINTDWDNNIFELVYGEKEKKEGYMLYTYCDENAMKIGTLASYVSGYTSDNQLIVDKSLFEYIEAKDFYNGLAKVRNKKGLYGYIYSDGSTFEDGIIYTNIDDSDIEFVIFENEGVCSVYNLEGLEKLKDSEYDYFATIENLPGYYIFSSIEAKEKDDEKSNNSQLYGIITKKGEEILPEEYEYINPKYIKEEIIVIKDGQYFFCDKDGKTTKDVEVPLDDIENVTGTGFYIAEKEKLKGVIYFDNNNKLVQITGYNYEDIKMLSEKRSFVKKDKVWHVIDNETSYVVDSLTGDPIEGVTEATEANTYTNIEYNGLGKYAIVYRDRNCGLINLEGKISIKIRNEEIKIYDEYVLLKRDEKYAAVSQDGVSYLGCYFKFIDESSSSGLVLVQNADNDLYGYAKLDGTGYAIKPQFVDAKAFKDGKAEVQTQDKKWKYILPNGEFVEG